MADVHLKLETFQALVLSRTMALKGSDDLTATVLAACQYYTKALEAKRHDGLIQVWYPKDNGKIEDMTP